MQICGGHQADAQFIQGLVDILMLWAKALCGIAIYYASSQDVDQ